MAALAAGLAAGFGLPPARAAEYCVTCAGPAAMYACVIDGVPKDAPSDPRMQLLCIQELARQGGHETCSVPRSAPQPCPGVMRAVAIPAGQAPVKTLPVQTDAPASQQEAAPGGDASTPAEPVGEPRPAQEPDPSAAAAVKKSKEPRTVEELANQTVEASKKGLKKAGDAVTGTAEKAGEQVGNAGSAVGTAAKKTWNCLKSFFSDC
jgi:hypothetical protein